MSVADNQAVGRLVDLDPSTSRVPGHFAMVMLIQSRPLFCFYRLIIDSVAKSPLYCVAP